MHRELLACVAQDSSTHHFDDFVLFQFVKEKDGRVSRPLIIDCNDPDVSKALLSCIGKLGRWEPGGKQGEPVAVLISRVLSFKKI
jgi:hypothetical protein